jgi:hypothetical protein
MASRCEQCGNDYDKSFEVTMPAALFFPLPASAGSAVKGGATNPGGKYVPYRRRRRQVSY